MSVPLLAYVVGTPHPRQRLDNSQRLRAFVLLDSLQKSNVGAKVTLLQLTFLWVVRTQEHIAQRHRGSQTLHRRVEEARVSVVVHSVRKTFVGFGGN